MSRGRKHWPVVIVLTLICHSLSAWAQQSSDWDSQRQMERLGLAAAPDKLFSPSVGQKFYEIAHQITNSGDVTQTQAEQAIIFLTATTTLDKSAKYALPDMIKISCRYDAQDNSKRVYRLLTKYVDEDADLDVATEAVRYLLEQLNSREERERLLQEILKNLGGKNAPLDSELDTLLGLLMAEKTDIQAAQLYLMQAYHNNKYNKLAFAKLAELVGEQVTPAMYAERLRLALGENPLDIEAALTFAQYAEQIQLYQVAADSYQYCADLFKFLYPSESLPASIYLPWAISSYNTQRNQHKCLQIASQFRQSGRFDLLLEAIAGKAAMKIEDSEQASRIFDAAEERAIKDCQLDSDGWQSLAWFYCFALQDANKALDSANKAYSIDPNSAIAAAILAYSLVMNGQMDWARPLIDNYEKNPISDLALAQIQLAQDKRSSAIQTLKSVIASDPGSLEAERAKEILARHGGEYIAPVTPDIISTVLKNSFGQAVVPVFTKPEEIISVQLNVRGSKFPYGREFGGSLAITNNFSEPLVVSKNALFTGNIRVDADVSGDLNKKIPNLISIRIRPSLPIEPGQSKVIPLRLVTAELRQILYTYPQASLGIEFTVFVDPVTTDDGKTINRLSSIKPAMVAVKRPGIELTSKYLQNRFNSLSAGKQGQEIRATQLFIGLLTEQHAMANRDPLYKFKYADWMPGLLKSGVLHSLAGDDWVTKVNTMAGMLSLPLDYDLIDAVAESLGDTHWPARLMAIYLLTRSQENNFGKVLDWTAKYDSNELVRNMAIALGAAVPYQKSKIKD